MGLFWRNTKINVYDLGGVLNLIIKVLDVFFKNRTNIKTLVECAKNSKWNNHTFQSISLYQFILAHLW